MDWIDRLEKHLGFLGLRYLTAAMVTGQIVVTLLSLQQPLLPSLLCLDMGRVADGQWWRLFTFVFTPLTGPMGLTFAIFWFSFLWTMGSSLEVEWGAFRSTLYFLLGWLLPVLAALLVYIITGVSLNSVGTYWALSVQLAFAAMAPEYTMLVMFILPLRMRWWSWMVLAWLVFRVAVGGWTETVDVCAGIGNYLLFFAPLGWQAMRAKRESMVGREVFFESRRQAELAVKAQAKRCAQCGKGVEADLRLCTCAECGEDGRFWCAEHLGVHRGGTAAPAPPPFPATPPPKRPRRTPSKLDSSTKPKTKRKG